MKLAGVMLVMLVELLLLQGEHLPQNLRDRMESWHNHDVRPGPTCRSISLRGDMAKTVLAN